MTTWLVILSVVLAFHLAWSTTISKRTHALIHNNARLANPGVESHKSTNVEDRKSPNSDFHLVPVSLDDMVKERLFFDPYSDKSKSYLHHFGPKYYIIKLTEYFNNRKGNIYYYYGYYPENTSLQEIFLQGIELLKSVDVVNKKDRDLFFYIVATVISPILRLNEIVCASDDAADRNSRYVSLDKSEVISGIDQSIQNIREMMISNTMDDVVIDPHAIKSLQEVEKMTPFEKEVNQVVKSWGHNENVVSIMKDVSALHRRVDVVLDSSSERIRDDVQSEVMPKIDSIMHASKGLTATTANDFVTNAEAVLTEAISCMESIESKMSREFMTDLRGRADLARLKP